MGKTPRYNGCDIFPILGTGNGIGLTLIGDYRPDGIILTKNNKWIRWETISDQKLRAETIGFIQYTVAKYHFFVIFELPIIPIGCYRVMDVDYKYENHHHSQYRYKIFGTEKWVLSEIIRIYIRGWGRVSIAIGIICCIGIVIELLFF